MTINDIDRNTLQGKALWAASVFLTTGLHKHLTPEQSLQACLDFEKKCELDDLKDKAKWDQEIDNIKKSRKGKFLFELVSLLNRHSIDNELETPDFLLCEYLNRCLNILSMAIATGPGTCIDYGPMMQLLKDTIRKRDKKNSLKEFEGSINIDEQQTNKSCGTLISPLLSAVNNHLTDEKIDKDRLLSVLQSASDVVIERATKALSPAEQSGLAGALVKIYRHYLDAKLQSV